MSSEQMHDASDQTRRFGAEKTEQAQENAQNARGLGLATSAAAQTADDKATGCKSKSNAADDALQQVHTIAMFQASCHSSED